MVHETNIYYLLRKYPKLRHKIMSYIATYTLENFTEVDNDWTERLFWSSVGMFNAFVDIGVISSEDCDIFVSWLIRISKRMYRYTSLHYHRDLKIFNYAY